MCVIVFVDYSTTFLFEKLSCAVEILIWSDAVDYFSGQNYIQPSAYNNESVKPSLTHCHQE